MQEVSDLGHQPQDVAFSMKCGRGGLGDTLSGDLLEFCLAIITRKTRVLVTLAFEMRM